MFVRRSCALQFVRCNLSENKTKTGSFVFPLQTDFSLYFLTRITHSFISRSSTIINHISFLKFDTESLVTETGCWIQSRDCKIPDRRCESWERKCHVLSVAECWWSKVVMKFEVSPFTELNETFLQIDNGPGSSGPHV
jgi:hypothetical protein